VTSDSCWNTWNKQLGLIIITTAQGMMMLLKIDITNCKKNNVLCCAISVIDKAFTIPRIIAGETTLFHINLNIDSSI
jgi:hypothetical protein